jgi:hypothetical protein
MTNLKTLLVSSIVAIAAFGCGKDDPVSNARRQGQLQDNKLVSGSYKSERCFLNKIETQTNLQNRWSIATFTFNDDGTGNVVSSNYSDATCTTLVETETTNFAGIQVLDLGGVKVIRMPSTGATINPTFYVPVAEADGGYSLDVDFTDGQSGAYIVEPSGADLDSFRQNPGQGVAFKRQ